MNSQERAEMIKENRNLLLSNLRAVWPSTLAGEPLYRVMLGSFPDYERMSCFKDLHYLEAKGYVERIDPRNGRVATYQVVKWDAARWRLTTHGTEIADKLETDPALEV